MKRIINITLFAVALVFTTSCSESFLETSPSEFLSADEINSATELNPEVGAGNLRGLYTTLFTTGSGGTDLDHDDYGQKGYDVFSDMLSGDMVLAGYIYGWYKGIVEYQDTRNFANNSNYKPWRFYYRLIFGANNILEGIEETDPNLEDPDNRPVAGQAKAIRAFAYFYLANFYGVGDYSMISGTPILPIYTDSDENAQPLSTGAEVFDLIIDDLEDAVDLLDGFSRSDINEINQDVAKGLLSYAYATVGDYAKVKTITDELMNSSFALLSEDQLVGGIDGDYSAGGFNDVNNYKNSWMWGQDITLDQELDLVSWWGQIDVFTYSYAAVGDTKTINLDLYNSIPNGDIRKSQFIPDPITGGTDQYVAGNKFYDPARKLQGQRQVETDYLYMRIEEMYLLNAEAAARTNDYGTARNTLKELLAIRMPDDYESYLNGISDSDLLDEVYKQTRIELWGEGKSYLAFKRFQKSLNLPPNHLSLAGEEISYDQDRVTFEIPEEEVLNNPNL